MKAGNLDILKGIQGQITSFDNKAGILVSIVSIIFALSINLLELLNKDSRIIFVIIFIIYLILFLASISFLLLVIIPRTHNLNQVYVNYYRDLIRMDFAKYEVNREKFFTEDEIQFDQILINATICSRKHFYLKGGIILSFLFTVILVLLMILKIIL